MTINAFWNAVMQKVGTLTKGAKGDPGKTPKIVIGSVTKLSPDAQPSATLVPLQSDPNTYTLNLQLPQGVQGEQGLQGIPGVGSKGLDGNNGLTPTIDPKTKHWMIGGTDTGVIAEGQTGKDADPSKYVTIVSFNQLRQQVQDNATALDALQKSAVNKDLQTQIANLTSQVTDLTAQVRALQEAKSDTSKSDEPAKSGNKDDQPAKSDTPASSVDSTSTPESSSTTMSPASADPAISASTADTSASSAAQ